MWVYYQCIALKTTLHTIILNKYVTQSASVWSMPSQMLAQYL